MRRVLASALIPVALLALSGCKLGKSGAGPAPTGQVVATVDGKEITLRELNAEMAGVSTPDPKARKAIEQQALGNIITRKILAKAASDQGIDKTPDFALQKQRAYDSLLVNLLQAKLVASVPTPSREEAAVWISSHPDIFSERKIWAVDQIRMARPSDPAVLKAFEPLKTMDQVQAELDKDHIPYQKGAGNLDAVGADPRIVEAIGKLPAGEIFIIPAGDGLLVNQIRSTQVTPFTGEPATQYALKAIARQRTQETVSRQFHTIMGKAGSTVRFNKAYQPPKPPAAATPPAKAAS